MEDTIKQNAKVLPTIIAIVVIVFVLGEITESFGRSFAKEFKIHEKEIIKNK